MFAFNTSLARGLFFRFRGIWAAMPFPWNTEEPFYIVSGASQPYVQGNYYYEGIHEGKPYYVREDDEYYIYWNTAAFTAWILGSSLAPQGGRFYKQGDIEGTYTPMVCCSGEPIVTEG